MIIGIDASRAVASQRTGTEVYAWQLIQTLIPMAAGRGHRLRLYFNRPPAGRLFPPASHVEEIAIPFPRLWTHLRLARELHRRPPDVFFTPAHVIPFTYHRPSVATVHDLGYHYFPEAHTRRQVAYLQWSTRHNGRRARRVIADSQATRADLIRFYALDPTKIEVVYPGIDPALRPVQEPARLAAVQQKYGVVPPYLLTIGTLQPRKNLVRLVAAYAASGVTHQFVLAGKPGWLSQPILDAVAALPPAVAGRVHLPGFVADEDKAALLSGAVALLYPSLYEGFGFPVLEGQACGTPVLCANTSSLPEVAGEAALLVDPLDVAGLAAAIRQIATEESLRRELVEKGLINVRRFTWEGAAVQTLKVLEAAAGWSKR
ncbi:MAG: glycosyltransferase family 4 protein [Chloroflexi bacterium]|nr:glycosyltransferase family 4 protein [Chloroflexota bacterium]MCI0580111.1 glycosyltransferase family 4 protein [Chloroflexota bacterium]MCI0649313.1 glycosyltransferase family 4 protein [Chloroflexota bacterium]MCI0725954.1 glycosyltransferase family 4 protein [Chloroflexota bacterium]